MDDKNQESIKKPVQHGHLQTQIGTIASLGLLGGLANGSMQIIYVGATISLLPFYGIMGIASSLIGSLALKSNDSQLGASSWGRAVFFGFASTAVFNLASDYTNLKVELQQVKAENVRVTESTIADLEAIAQDTEDVKTQKKVIAAIEDVAEGSKEAIVKEKAQNAIVDVASDSDRYEVQLKAIRSLTKSALESEDIKEVREVKQFLEEYPGSRPFNVQAFLDRSIEKLERKINELQEETT